MSDFAIFKPSNNANAGQGLAWCNINVRHAKLAFEAGNGRV